jgi:type II secretory pathway pseudopilin PulG
MRPLLPWHGARDVPARSSSGKTRGRVTFFARSDVRTCCGPGRPALRAAAFTIIEAIVYISVLLVLLGAAYMAMYRCIDRSVALRRNAGALTSALEAGERWRADVRSARGPVQIDKDLLRIPTSRGEIAYRFEDHSVLRRISSNSWVSLLDGVKTSDMQSDQRQEVTAWRWDFELLPVRKDTADTNRFHPLFTFLAVPNTTTQ